MLTIVLCADNNYAMPAGVMMYSVCRNSGHASFYVIVPADFTEGNKAKIKKIAYDFNSEVTFITMDTSILKGFPVGRKDQPEHISIAAYYRLFLPELLPTELDKVLYLDCDLICMSSLLPLWETNIDNRPLACVKDIPFTGICEAIRLGYDESKGYFNSGVLLINLAYWREHNVRRDFIAFLSNHRDLVRYHDQDVLNSVFQGEVVFLHPKNNAQDRLFHQYNPGFPYSDKEVVEARKHPVIVHFTYKNKPWILGGTHPYQKYFNNYKSATPWKSMRLKPKKAADLKGYIANILVILGLYKYHDDYITL